MNNQLMKKPPQFQLLFLFLLACSTGAFAQGASLQVEAQADSLRCHGDDDGELFWQINGGLAPYSYEWQRLNNAFVFASGDQSSTALAGPVGGDLEANSYIITVRDAAGAEARDTIEIGEPTRILVSDIELDNARCGDSCDGRILMTIGGGTGALLTQWSDGPELGPNREGLCPGEYVFFIDDERGCRQKGSIGINAPPVIETEVVSVIPSCIGAANGELSATGTGGTGELTFAWSNGEVGTNITGLQSGEYELTITDQDACELLTAVTLPTGPQMQANVQVNYGCGDGQLLVSTQPINGTPPYTYNWSTGSSAPWLFQMSSGTYALSLEDSDGCQDEVTFELDFVPPLIVEEDIQAVTCPGSSDGAVNLSIEGGLPPYLVRWGDNITALERTALSGGTYDYNITAGGCALAGVVFVEEPPAWEVEFIFSPQTDQFLTATAFVTGGSFPYQFQWSNGSNGMSANNLNPELVYTLRVTDVNGCLREWEVSPGLTSTEGLANDLPIEVYPNPSTGVFYLSPKRSSYSFDEYTVYAPDGRVVHCGKLSLSDPLQIDLGNFPAGLYQLRVLGGAKPIAIPLVKQ